MVLEIITGLLNSAVDITVGFLGTIKNIIVGFAPELEDILLLGVALILAFVIKSTKMVKSLTPLFIIYNFILIYLLLKLV